ncbi:hypothetical protein F2P56_012979 [Juglans regia]|uniref:RNase H type-1 domain-containing protein n=1 Tax=Juglans regia TaxID=51240 RepID=A0A833XNF2_JUGRE|nr:hypothetical protein F2P56_012979 [Juglans regia]
MASKIEIEVKEPKAVELKAIFRDLQLCVSMGISRIQVESDCLLVVEALEQNTMDGSLLGLLYWEIKSLSSCFVDCSYVYVPREGNRAAHTLAQYAKNVDDIAMWWDCIPDFISQVIWLDKCL